MNYVSTRSAAVRVPSAHAIANGIAPDGGLYTPEALPQFSPDFLRSLAPLSYAERAAKILACFLTDFTEPELLAAARAAYAPDRFCYPEGYAADVPLDAVALKSLSDTEHVLELYWGPTAAFKDMALQILPHLLTASLRKLGETRTACILVATSGDTGKAALEGFRDVPGTKIVVFYPNDGVSDVQKLQMVTQEGANVGVSAVSGNFDDAQTGVKRVFTDPAIRRTLDGHGCFFSSANSINFGRLAPQIVYYVSAYLDLCARGAVRFGDPVNVCVPTGNFGNILAAYIAKKAGLPIARLLCASNANNVLTDFLATGVYDRRRPFHKTLSPSMDILISSNVERLLYYISGSDTEFVAACQRSLSEEGHFAVDPSRLADFRGFFCDDTATKQTIREVFTDSRYLIDPHTAVGMHASRRYRAETGDRTPCILASTASAFKFCAGVLDALTGKPAENDFDALAALSRVTGQPAPKPLSSLDGKRVRFEGVTAKEAIGETALRLLGI
ncbi:MAG: threonine synthase [Eubacteriales bacterium]|nr:threonine synthase [Eubacteriales bacterium]